MLPDLTFEFAGLLFTRVLSASIPGYVTFDLGNKAIAADPSWRARPLPWRSTVRAR